MSRRLPNRYGPYATRELATGIPGQPDVGDPPWEDGIIAAFPGRDFKIKVGPTDSYVFFGGAELTSQEEADLAQAHDDWVPFDVAEYRKRRRRRMAERLDRFINARVNNGRRLSLLMLHTMAVADGDKPSRAAHIRTLFDWIDSAAAEYEARVIDVNAAGVYDDIVAVRTNWNTWLASNPLPAVTVPSARAIAD